MLSTAIRGVRERIIAARSRSGLSVLIIPACAGLDVRRFIPVTGHLNQPAFKENQLRVGVAPSSGQQQVCRRWIRVFYSDMS